MNEIVQRFITLERTIAEYLVAAIKEHLGAEQLTTLSRIVFLTPDEPAVQALNRTVHVEHSLVDVHDSTFAGVELKHAYIITSQSLDTAAR